MCIINFQPVTAETRTTTNTHLRQFLLIFVLQQKEDEKSED